MTKLKHIKKTIEVFEEAINNLSYDSMDTKEYGAMMKGFKAGYKAACDLRKIIKEAEQEDIPL